MKKSGEVFFGILIVSMLVLVACQIPPGKAVSIATKTSVVTSTCNSSIHCQGDYVNITNANCSTQVTGPCAYGCNSSNGNCYSTCRSASQSCSNNGQCCSGLSCNGGTCQQTCTPATFCQNSAWLNTTNSNCTKTLTYCQYGCSNGACNPAPSCTPSTTCLNSTASMNITSACTNYTYSCQNGCNATTGSCNEQTCTASCYDNSGNLNATGVLNYTLSNCNSVTVTGWCQNSTTMQRPTCTGSGSSWGYVLVSCPAGQNCTNGHC